MSIPTCQQHSAKAWRSKAKESRIDSDQIRTYRHRRRTDRDRRRAIAIEFVLYGAIEIGAVTDDLGGDVGETGRLQLLIDERLVARPHGSVCGEVVDYAGDAADIPDDALRRALGVVVEHFAGQSDQAASARVGAHAARPFIAGKRFVHLIGD